MKYNAFTTSPPTINMRDENHPWGLLPKGWFPVSFPFFRYNTDTVLRTCCSFYPFIICKGKSFLPLFLLLYPPVSLHINTKNTSPMLHFLCACNSLSRSKTRERGSGVTPSVLLIVGDISKPEEIIEHFCLGRRRLHLFGTDNSIRPGPVPANHLLMYYFRHRYCTSFIMDTV